MSSASTDRSWRLASSATACSVSSGSTPPVGLCGEFRMSARLRAVMRERNAARSMSNPFSGSSGTGTTRTSRKFAIEA
jgi:hypothetical protein